MHPWRIALFAVASVAFGGAALLALRTIQPHVEVGSGPAPYANIYPPGVNAAELGTMTPQEWVPEAVCQHDNPGIFDSDLRDGRIALIPAGTEVRVMHWDPSKQIDYAQVKYMGRDWWVRKDSVLMRNFEAADKLWQ